MKRIYRNGKRIGTAILALMLMVCASACAGPKLSADTFDDYCTSVIQTIMDDGYLNIHFFFANPEAVGLGDVEPTFGHYVPQSEEDKEELSRKNAEVISGLMRYDRDSLSESQKKTYDILLYSLQNSFPGIPDYYDNPNAPNYGWQAQIQISLAELDLHTQEDVDNYLLLLADMPRYAEELMQYQQEKKQAGLGISVAQADLAIEECETFINAGDNNLLITSFDERIENVEGLSAEQKQTYKQKNKDAVEQSCIPAYKTMAEGLEQAKDENNDGSLASLPEGKRVYKSLLKQYTMSDVSPEELQAELEEELKEDHQQLLNIAYSSPSSYDAWFQTDLDTEDPKASLEMLKEKSKEDFPALETEVPYQVHQVSKALEDTITNPAFYMIPYLDQEGVENSIYINEKHMTGDVLPTLAHEGFPGHLYQTNYSRQSGDSVLCQLMAPSGYSEGWATYVENYSYRYLVEDEQLAQLYRINSMYSLNASCQMDLGVNYYGWDQEELADALLEELGITLGDEELEEFYQLLLASPGEYFKYYYTARQIEKAYEEASEELGSQFDDKAFHKAVLDAVPTQEGIEQAVDAYIEKTKNGEETKDSEETSALPQWQYAA